jgi:nicotine blue oxidoreductase
MSQVYLLAAGRGRRAGGPKAWLEHQGEPLLKKQLDFLLKSYDPQRIAVSIQADWLSQCRTLSEQVCWVAVNPDAAPLASLLELMKVNRMIKWSFIYHVDQPVWEPGLFTALEAKIFGAQANAFVPSYQGRRGHPVLVSHGLGPDLLTLDGASDRLDAFLRDRGAAEVPVDYPCILENWNGAAP